MRARRRPRHPMCWPPHGNAAPGCAPTARHRWQGLPASRRGRRSAEKRSAFPPYGRTARVSVGSKEQSDGANTIGTTMALMTAPLASLRRLRRMPLISPRLWLRRLVFWIGAVMVALVAIGFAWAANAATDVFLRVQ